MYALTGDTIYKDKAYHLAKKLLPAFETPTGIPHALVSLNSGVSIFSFVDEYIVYRFDKDLILIVQHLV